MQWLTHRLGKSRVDSSTIRTENGIGIQQWFQHCPHMNNIQLSQDEVCSCTTSISGYQYGNVICASPSGSAHASSTPCWTRDLTLPFEGRKKEGFILFNNTMLMMCPMA